MARTPARIFSAAEEFAECTVILGGLNRRNATGLFNPQDDILAGASGVVAQVMVQTNFLTGPGFEESNGLIGPVSTVPPF